MIAETANKHGLVVIGRQAPEKTKPLSKDELESIFDKDLIHGAMGIISDKTNNSIAFTTIYTGERGNEVAESCLDVALELTTKGFKFNYWFTGSGVAVYGLKTSSETIDEKDLLVAINKNIQCIEALRELIENDE
jgi:hypothetical protein